ncbi:YhcH/YjgK/YiaL family protein [Paenibacillus sp. GD4]|uniref:YhcH/YjgK/YiaL family protein n=1 Tax=Paenibacillus sp. GD4 TaxID=3068890 RepID=UPI00279687F0|nr:YhcH/YjgK/YiaL family protein [Paenibacillus sp. GD4]MDQ1913593.1 YhcH/YjgK/YiaL family protein [Paenibacillus sp. GD4]
MILGDIKFWEKEKGALSPVFQKAIDFLQSRDLGQLELGKYEIMGDDMFALVQELIAVKPGQRKSECHAKYVDLQYLVQGGEERIYVARASESNVAVEDRLADNDYLLFDEVENEMEIRLKPGMFAVFFPADLHRPGCSPVGGEKLKKVVFKINSALLS